MCLASVYFKEPDKEKLVTDKVTRVQIDPVTSEILCINLFGEKVRTVGRLELIDLQNARITIIPKT